MIRLERKDSYSSSDKNEPNIWRFMHVWNNAQKKQTARGFYTINNTADSKYNLVFTNDDRFVSYRILRGYLYVSATDPKPVVSDFEGAAYGRYFSSIVATGRWYNI
jgi:hypothetical protein